MEEPACEEIDRKLKEMRLVETKLKEQVTELDRKETEVERKVQVYKETSSRLKALFCVCGLVVVTIGVAGIRGRNK
jgi:hypothetical protein